MLLTQLLLTLSVHPFTRILSVHIVLTESKHGRNALFQRSCRIDGCTSEATKRWSTQCHIASSHPLDNDVRVPAVIPSSSPAPSLIKRRDRDGRFLNSPKCDEVQTTVPSSFYLHLRLQRSSFVEYWNSSSMSGEVWHIGRILYFECQYCYRFEA